MQKGCLVRLLTHLYLLANGLCEGVKREDIVLKSADLRGAGPNLLLKSQRTV